MFFQLFNFDFTNKKNYMKKKFTIIIMLLVAQFLTAQTAPTTPVCIENTYQTGPNKPLNIRDLNNNIIGTFNINEVLVANGFSIGANYNNGSDGTSTRAWALLDLPNTAGAGALTGKTALGSTFSGPKCGVYIAKIKSPQQNIRTGVGTSFANVKKNGVDIVAFQNQCYHVLSTQYLSGIHWYKIQLYTSSGLSHSTGWINGSTSLVDYFTTGYNDALYSPTLQGVQNVNLVNLSWAMEGKPSGFLNTNFDVLKNLNNAGFSSIANKTNNTHQDNLLPTQNDYKVIANYGGCKSVESNVQSYTISNPCSPSSSTTGASVCSENLPYIWNGNSYTNSGVFTYVIPNGNAAGCDSACHLILTIDDYSTLPFSIVGPSSINIPSVDVVYSTNILPNTTSYNWVYNGGFDNFDMLTNTAKLTCSTANSSSGVLKCTVYNINGCVNTTSLSITVVNTLPLKTFVFEARKNENKALLNFKTTDETNINKYEIERSIDGNRFIKIEEIKANNFARNEYNYFDEQPFETINYYRIKTIEKDGKITYSEVKPLDFSIIKKHSIKIYPNPVASILNVEFNKLDNIQKFEFYNSLGQILLVKEAVNKTTEIIDFSNFPKGFYVIKAFNKNGLVITEKFVKQ